MRDLMAALPCAWSACVGGFAAGRAKPLVAEEGEMVRPERFERPTYWFVASCSIQLSYGRTWVAATSRWATLQG
jgi:hypothetical protein